jgi:hypothetical protein
MLQPILYVLIILLLLILCSIIISSINIKNEYTNRYEHKIYKGGSIAELFLKLKTPDFNFETLSQEEIIKIISHVYRCNYFNIDYYGTREKIYEMDDKLTNFIDGCTKIADIINRNGAQQVIAPGDSPYKVVKYIQLKKLCPDCNFIIFPISGVLYDEFNNNKSIKLFNFLDNYLPKDNLDKIMIIDYIYYGNTINAFIQYYNSKRSKIYRPFTSKLQSELDIIISVDPEERILIDDTSMPKPIQHIINIGYFFNKITSNLMEFGETNNTRCLPKNEEYEMLDISSFDAIGCLFFIYTAILYTINKRLVNIILSIIPNNTPPNEFFTRYKNKIIDITIYNNVETFSTLRNVMLKKFFTNNNTFRYFFICSEKMSESLVLIPYCRIIDIYTRIRYEFPDFMFSYEIDDASWGLQDYNPALFSIYNITYEQDGGEIISNNMVYLDYSKPSWRILNAGESELFTLDDHLLIFRQLESFKDFTNNDPFKNNKDDIKLISTQLKSITPIKLINSDINAKFKEQFDSVRGNPNPIILLLYDLTLIYATIIKCLDNTITILIKDDIKTTIPYNLLIDNFDINLSLVIACSHNRINSEIIGRLLHSGVDINATDSNGLTALMHITRNPNINTKDKEKFKNQLLRAGATDYTPPIQTPPIQIPPIQTPPIQPIQTPPIQTPPIQPIQTPPIQPIQTPPMQTPPMQTPPMQTPPMQTPPMQTPPMQTPEL